MANNIIPIKTKAIQNILLHYPSLRIDEVPIFYEIHEIEYKKQNVEEYEVIFWHRLLKSIYQEPQEIEIEGLNDNTQKHEIIVIRKTEDKTTWTLVNSDVDKFQQISSNEKKPLPINWRYYVGLPNGGMAVIKSIDYATKIFIGILVDNKRNKNKTEDEAKKLISLLLEEAKKEKNHLFNPYAEYKNPKNIKQYIVINVYLANYYSAEHMTNTAISQEEKLRDEFLKYDARKHLHDKEKMMHVEQYMLICGAYYLSAIVYYFMALEGFVNIIYQIFINEDVRAKLLNYEQRFDLEQKIVLMPLLCRGHFKESAGIPKNIYSKFQKFKNYRNTIFHSKIDDCLKSLVFVEDGFVYPYDMSKSKEQFMPGFKIMLKKEDVIDVKKLVDEMIKCMLSMMTNAARKIAKKYILNRSDIPFKIQENGTSSLIG